MVDGRAVNLDAPPRVQGDRVLVPLRAVAEALGSLFACRFDSFGKGKPSARRIVIAKTRRV